MPSRASLQTLLEEDPVLTSAGLQAVFAGNAVDTPSEDLFIVVRWGEKFSSFGARGPENLQVWAHDTNRDYGRIDTLLQRVESLLQDAVHLEGEDGWVLTCASSRGQSDDLFDPGYNTCTRYAEFSVVTRYDSQA